MTRRNYFAFLGSLALAGALGFGLKSVLADGIPSPNPLYYSGTLTEGGTPVNGSRQITINLWLNGTAQIGEKAICTATTATTPVVNGRFRIALDSSCKGAINANANVFVEVLDGTTSLGRAAIGAVPYAVEADHAVNATNAVDGGGIASAISSLQGQVHPASGFHAWLTNATSIPNVSTGETVAFDHVDYDLAGEYVSTTGVFKPKQPGVYLLHCNLEFAVAASTAWTIGLYRNGTELNFMDLDIAALGGLSPSVTSIEHLSAGDSVTCETGQTTGSAQALYVTSGIRNTFSAARLY